MSSDCPHCGTERKIYFRKNAFVSFVCSCGYVKTAPDYDTLKKELREARKIERAKSSAVRRYAG